jgi:hypothetical protein
MKKLFFYGLFLIFVSCSSDDNGNGEEIFEPQIIEPIEISKGYMTGSGMFLVDEQLTVIYTESQWEELIESMIYYNSVNDEFAQTPINFDDFQVFVVMEEVKYNGGWSIDITEIIEELDEIYVKVENLLTGNATSMVMRPFHIVKIPKSDKPVVFERIFPED